MRPLCFPRRSRMRAFLALLGALLAAHVGLAPVWGQTEAPDRTDSHVHRLKAEP
jgi:hypothetical protein